MRRRRAVCCATEEESLNIRKAQSPPAVYLWEDAFRVTGDKTSFAR